MKQCPLTCDRSIAPHSVSLHHYKDIIHAGGCEFGVQRRCCERWAFLNTSIPGASAAAVGWFATWRVRETRDKGCAHKVCTGVAAVKSSGSSSERFLSLEFRRAVDMQTAVLTLGITVATGAALFNSMKVGRMISMLARSAPGALVSCTCSQSPRASESHRHPSSSETPRECTQIAFRCCVLAHGLFDLGMTQGDPTPCQGCNSEGESTPPSTETHVVCTSNTRHYFSFLRELTLAD